MNEEWYKQEIAKLIAIIENNSRGVSIARPYVLEKLTRMFNNIPIGVHDSLKDRIKEIREKGVFL